MLNSKQPQLTKIQSHQISNESQFVFNKSFTQAASSVHESLKQKSVLSNKNKIQYKKTNTYRQVSSSPSSSETESDSEEEL